MSELAVQFDDESVGAQEGDQAEVTEQPTEQSAEQSEQQPEGAKENEEVSQSPDEEGPISFSEEQQRFINEKIVAKQVAKRGEAERRAQELEQRLQELEAQIPKQDMGKPKPPTDVWADDYDQQVAKYEENLAKWVQQETEKQYYEQQAMRAQQEQEMAAQQEFMEKAQTYSEKAKSLGISSDDLKVAGSAVAQFGIPNELVTHILEHDQGPAITMYLARNLSELQSIQNMNPVQAAVHIAKNIEPKVTRSIKRQAPPEPTETVQGSGLPEKERGPKGAVYE